MLVLLSSISSLLVHLMMRTIFGKIGHLAQIKLITYISKKDKKNMLDWIRNVFNKKDLTQFKGAAQNKYFIEKYKNFDKAIMTYYQAKDINGKIVD